MGILIEQSLMLGIPGEKLLPALTAHTRILQRYVIPNSRGARTHCEICNIKFQLLVKQEHQCKRCLRSICEECGPQRRTIYQFDGSWALHRCCIVCMREIETMQEYQNSFKLIFGQDSEFIEDWINKLNKQHRQYDEILNEYTESLTATNSNTIKFKREADVILMDLMGSYNYSFRHFFHILTEGIKPQTINSKICNVMIAVYGKIGLLPYIPELIYMVVFFLFFSSEAHSYFIITRLIEKVYPQYIRVKKMKKDNLLSSSLKTILEMYRICVDRVDRNQLEAIAQYLQNRLEAFIISFTLNICSLPNSLFILDQMLKSGTYLPLYKGIASLLSYCREELAAFKSFSDVEVPMLREISLEKLKNIFIKFEKTDVKFEISNDVFDSAEHRKLFEKYKQMQILYGKLESNLKDQEIKLKDMSEKLQKKISEHEQQTKKVSSLQIQLIKLSQNIPKLTKFRAMEQQHKYATERNIQLQKKCQALQLHIQNTQKQRNKYEKNNRMWQKMQHDYLQQIKNLKTRNQILEIKVAAKEIDFNTSFIERKLSSKNNQNQILKDQVNHLKSQVEYYKIKVLENRFSNSNTGQLKMPVDDRRDQQFEKHIRHSNEIVSVKSKELEEKMEECEEKGKKIVELEDQIRRLNEQLKQVQEISDIIKSIPEQFSYEESISQLERIIPKQTNFIKKKTLQSTIEGFKKCHKELRFRIIDARIKEQKIKNSFLIKLLNPATFQILKKEEDDKKGDQLVGILSKIEDKKIDDGNKGDCRLM